MELNEIGKVKSCFPDKFGTPRQANLAPDTTGWIEIHKEWDPGQSLKELEGFSHLWVLFLFHKNAKNFQSKISPPRLPQRRIGVFATRSPFRPNPIGMSLVKITRIESPRIYISGLDMIDGTPVIDIKPYIHTYDHAENSEAGWLNDVQGTDWQVVFCHQAQKQIEASEDPLLETKIRDILKTDIRNQNDKRSKNEGKILGFFLEDFNVVFQFEEKTFTVLSVDPRL